MILTTTPSIEGKRAVKYLGLVSGDAILGANIASGRAVVVE
jgi:uncharacterized protein YbjQ (UPF0145 family)